jgi:hypothetical protein
MAAGPFGSPNRMVPGDNEKNITNGWYYEYNRWERGIDVVRTGYLLVL